MSERSLVHHSFVIERTYPVQPAHVYRAFADPAAKRRWFAGPDEWRREGGHELDFREGGRERVSGGQPGGPVHHFNALYYDIVPNERIVYSYEMHLNEARISVSLATLEFRLAGSGTRLVVTEQGVFLDGYDQPEGRERGTRELLDNLARELSHEAATA